MSDYPPIVTLTSMVVPPSLASHKLTEHAIGRRWLREQVELAAKAIPVGKGFTPSTIGRINEALGHPLASELYHINIGRRKSALRFDLMERCLAELAETLNLADLRPRLRDSGGYEKLEYELLVASGYHRSDPNISINLNQPGPDVTVISQSGQEAWVECKRKDSVTALEQRMIKYRQLIDQPLIDQMKAEKLYHHVNFRVLDDPSDINPDELIRRVIGLCKTNDLASERPYDRIEVSTVKLAERDQEIPDEILQSFLSQRTAIRSTSVPVREGVPDPSLRRKPIQVQWFLPDDLAGRVKGIESSLGQAASQTPKSGPSVVYIDVNSDDYNEIQELLPLLSQRVREVLGGAFRRVNFVVLTAVWTAMTLNEIEGWGVDVAVIRQPKPRSSFPAGVPVLGLTEGFEQLWLPGTWAQAVLEPVRYSHVSCPPRQPRIQVTRRLLLEARQDMATRCPG